MLKTLEKLRNRHEFIYKIVLFLAAACLIVYLLPKQGKFKYEFENLKGKPWHHENLIAPFDFAISKNPDEINKEKENIENIFIPYFKKDSLVYIEKKQKYKSEFEYTWKSINADKQRFFNYGSNILDTIYNKGILQNHESIQDKPANTIINLMVGNLAEEKQLKDFFTVRSAYSFAQDKLKQIKEKDERESVLQIIENCLAQNIFYDPEFSEKVLDQNISNISLTRGKVIKGQIIISKGEIVDNEKYQILTSLKNEYETNSDGQSSYFFILIGHIVISLLCLLLVGVFLFLFRKDIFEINKNIAFILSLMAMTIAMATIPYYIDRISYYMLPYCILPIIIRAFFDTRIALFIHLCTMLIIAIIAPNRFDFTFIQLVGGISAIFSIVNMRNRSQVFISGAIIFSVYVISFYGINIIQIGGFDTISWKEIPSFLISAGLTLLAYPMIFLFEKMFGFISDVSLMELSDTNNPLLRELASKAPGTFQHSLQVANISEEILFNIGGNSLLARTGALYHDIGKSDSPIYFIENQSGGINPHNDLPYEESATIIIDHVIRGIEKAKKANLPDQVIDFIRTHHGTTRPSYFYKKYKEQNPNEIIDEKKFTYPGPIPYSKETAVVMIADSIEAASRSLKSYTPESINDLVEKIITNLIEQDQFVNSNITFKDITQIKKIVKRKMTNIYHLRIEYPK